MIPPHKCTPYCDPDEGVHCIVDFCDPKFEVTVENWNSMAREQGVDVEALKIKLEADATPKMSPRMTAMGTLAIHDPKRTIGFLVWLREKESR